MWSGQAPPPPPPPPVGAYGVVPQAPMATAATATTPQGQKNDVFVGNLAFNTTEEQLHTIFSEVGRVLKVRLVTDVDTGKPKGYAFVEFADPQAALSAIRNVNDTELNGRNIRVNFSNSSHLEALAGQLGMDLTNNNKKGSSQQQQQQTQTAAKASTPGTTSVADAIKNMSKGEMYDIIQKIKEIADEDESQARRLLASHPQLPEAALFLMSQLDMVQTPTNMVAPMALAPLTTTTAATTTAAARVDPRRMDPRTSSSTPAAAAPAPDVAAAPARVDPRARMDPRKRR